MQNVNNIPNYARNKKYFVVREVDGELWFYSAYNDYSVAYSMTVAYDGFMVVVNRELV